MGADADATAQSGSDPVVVLSCGQCRAIVADTTSLVGADDRFGLITVRTAVGVAVGAEPQLASVGYDAISTYQVVACAACNSVLGRQYISTPPHLDLARGMYTFSTKAIQTYTTGSGTPSAPASCRGLLSLGEIREQYERISEIVMILAERIDAVESVVARASDGRGSKTRR